MPTHVLGLDVGGANLKAAAADGRAVSVPFALWRQPDRLPAALADLAALFPETREFAATMTGELCDCFPTKRDGVKAITDALVAMAGERRLRIWSTAGKFLPPNLAADTHMEVAAANWHALATFVGRYNLAGTILLVDTGSTTTDIIPIVRGQVRALGLTDPERLRSGELVYMGVKRTPVCALLPPGVGAAEFFATMQDAYVLLGDIEENSDDRDTADGRPSTRPHAHARLSRMLCGDPELTSPRETERLARELADRQRTILGEKITTVLERMGRSSRLEESQPLMAIVSGSGEFLARDALEPMQARFSRVVSLSEQLGPVSAACAPAHAVAVLAEEDPA